MKTDFPAAVREPIEHELKCWPPFFEDVAAGRKPFEVRKMDRDYRIGDTLELREWDPRTETYSGRQCTRRVTYILRSEIPGTWTGPISTMALQLGYGVLGIEPVQAPNIEPIPAVRPERLPPLWFASVAAYPDEGSHIVAADTEEAAMEAGALALGNEPEDGVQNIAVIPCDPHEMAAKLDTQRTIIEQLRDALLATERRREDGEDRCSVCENRGKHDPLCRLRLALETANALLESTECAP